MPRKSTARVKEDSTKSALKQELNNTGIFLEDAVENLLKSGEGNTVTRREVPYSLPEYNKTGTVDLLHITLFQHLQENNLILPIECKKSTDQAKIWVFISHEDKQDTVLLEKVSTGVGSPNMKYATIINNAMPEKYCINCFQFHQKKATLNRDNNLRAYEAMRTPNEFISAIHGIDKPLEVFTKIDIQEKASWILIPIVCTNSKLYIAEYNKEDIDLESGNLDPEKNNLKEVPWVFYKFPLGFGVRPNIRREYPGKRLTIVVNSKELQSLITYLLSNVVNYVRDAKNEYGY